MEAYLNLQEKSALKICFLDFTVNVLIVYYFCIFILIKINLRNNEKFILQVLNI